VRDSRGSIGDGEIGAGVRGPASSPLNSRWVRSYAPRRAGSRRHGSCPTLPSAVRGLRRSESTPATQGVRPDSATGCVEHRSRLHRSTPRLIEPSCRTSGLVHPSSSSRSVSMAGILARFGRIDRSSQGCRCALRCRRTEAVKGRRIRLLSRESGVRSHPSLHDGVLPRDLDPRCLPSDRRPASMVRRESGTGQPVEWLETLAVAPCVSRRFGAMHLVTVLRQKAETIGSPAVSMNLDRRPLPRCHFPRETR
jgi:hypothetical protein